jgi:Domain of Unknown Function (DUF1206)
MSQERGLVWLTRLGFAARGFLYLIIAWLAFGTGRAEDLTGALEHLRGERALLILILAGFLAYGFWRVTDALFDSEGHGEGKKGALGRAGAGASGIIYLFLAWQAWRLLKGDGGSGGGAQEQAGTVMNLPGGTLLIEIAGVILFLAGLWQLKRAISCDFCKHLRPDIQHQGWVKWMGRGGYGARGVIFIVTAIFLISAGLSGDPGEAGGMQDALRWMDSPVNLIVAAGLALFGAFSLVEARFRQINPPPVDRVAASLT